MTTELFAAAATTPTCSMYGLMMMMMGLQRKYRLIFIVLILLSTFALEIAWDSTHDD